MGKRLLIIGTLIGLGAGVAFYVIPERGMIPPPMPALDADMDPKVRDAIDAALGVLSEHADNAEAWIRLGLIYDANGLDSLAAKTYQQALQIEGSTSKWWYWLALVQDHLNQPELAMASLDRSVELDGSYLPARRQRGLWLLKDGQVEAADQAFASALRINANDPSTLVAAARASLERGDVELASQRLESAISLTPGYSFAHLLLGTAYRRLGRLEDAETQFALGVGSKPIYEDPWKDEVLIRRAGYSGIILEADRLLELGKIDEVIINLQALRLEYPQDVVLLNKIAHAYMLQGRNADALRLLNQARSIDPSHAITHLKLSTLYERKNDMGQAIAMAGKAVELNPNYGTAYRQLGRLQSMIKQYDQAIVSLQGAVQNGRNEPEIVLTIGTLQAELNRWPQAMSTFASLVRRTPDSSEAWLWYSRSAAEAGDFPLAMSALQKAYDLNPRHPNLISTRDRVLALQNNQSPRPR